MNTRPIAVSLATVMLLVVCGACMSPVPHSSDNSWDYLLFVVQWPQTGCADTDRRCYIPQDVNYFTMHGLWPNRNDGSYPSDCDPSNPFDANKISDLMDDMHKYWPDLYDPTGTDFYAHEWNKHGTCAESDSVISGQHAYFSQILQLRKNTPIDESLAAAGIVPSNSTKYNASDVESAIRSRLGVTPQLDCTSTDQGILIKEIHLCVDKSLSFMECPSSASALRSSDQCQDGFLIPEIHHSDEYAQ